VGAAVRPCALLEVLAVLTFVGVLAAHFKLVLCLSLLVATSLRVVNFGPLRLALFAGLVKAKKPKHPTLIGKNPFQINVLISLCWHTQCVCVCGGGLVFTGWIGASRRKPIRWAQSRKCASKACLLNFVIFFHLFGAACWC
jgi:hypothetical protein